MERRNEKANDAPAQRWSYRVWVPIVAGAVFCACAALADPPEKRTESGQSAGTPPKKASTEQAPSESDEAEAIKRLIRQRMKENAKAAPTEAAPKRAAPEGKPGQPPSTPAKGRKGCGAGGEQVDLTPPPSDQPPPRWVCESETVELAPLWRGQPAEFVFKVRNEGEGVLTFKARGG